MTVHRYELRFGREGGCPLSVVQDMARHDRATVLSVANDLACEPGHVRGAVLLGDMAPTLPRWATFVVGASVRWIVETGPRPWERQNPSDAIEPKGPRS